MTQEGPFEGTPYQDMYRQRVSREISFVTLGFDQSCQRRKKRSQ